MSTLTETGTARAYPVGCDRVDLVKLIGTFNQVPDADRADWVIPEKAGDAQVGEIAYVHSYGDLRRGVVVKVGKTRITVAFTTRGAVDRSDCYVLDIKVTVKAEQLEYIRLYRPSAPVVEQAPAVEQGAQVVNEASAAPAPVVSTTTLTGPQIRNLDVIKANGGTAKYGPSWPRGLHVVALESLHRKGFLNHDPKVGYWLAELGGAAIDAAQAVLADQGALVDVDDEGRAGSPNESSDPDQADQVVVDEAPAAPVDLVDVLAAAPLADPVEIQRTTGTLRDPEKTFTLTADQVETLWDQVAPADGPVDVVIVEASNRQGVKVGPFGTLDDALAWWAPDFNRFRRDGVLFFPVPAGDQLDEAPAAGVAQGDQLVVDEAPAQDTQDGAQAAADASTGSEVVAALESLWAAMRRHHPELPPVVMITGMGAHGSKWGHTGYARWAPGSIGVELDKSRKAAADRLTEVFIAGERLACGATLTAQTVLHEAAHVIAWVRGVQDTSRQGRYHNKTFVKICAELGLIWPADAKPDRVIGFSAVVITDETRKRYGDELAQLGKAIQLSIPLAGLMALGLGVEGEQGVEGPNIPRTATVATGRQASLAMCACEEPRRIRVAPSILALGGIKCSLCDEEFASQGDEDGDA